MKSKAKGPNACLRAVAQDIIAIQIDPNAPTNAAYRRFFAVLRKHGIKQGTKNKNGSGVMCDNFEWTGARAIFESHLRREHELNTFMVATPKDLFCY